MNVDEMFSGGHLKAEHLKGSECKVTIEKVVMEEMDGKRKPVVSFSGKDKTWVLNRINTETIATLHGDDTDAWIGKDIILYPAKTTFQGGIVDCIRVRGAQEPQSSGGTF